jgi:hypothetical protein
MTLEMPSSKEMQAAQVEVGWSMLEDQEGASMSYPAVSL